MPNLFLELDFETQLFLMEDEKPDGPISIDDICLGYEGFNVVELNYGFYVHNEDFLENSVLEISEEYPFNIRVKGVAKIKTHKQDLYEYLIEDENPNISFVNLNDEYFPNPDGEKLKIKCQISKKKPK